MASSPFAPVAPPALTLERASDGRPAVKLTGTWSLRSMQPVAQSLRQQLAAHARQTRDAHWDLSGVTRMDHAGAMMLWQAWGRQRAANVNLRAEHEGLFEHLQAAPMQEPPAEKFHWLTPGLALTRPLMVLGRHIIEVVVLLGRVSLAFLQCLAHPSRMPWKEISANVYRTGAQALGITALVGFLIGVVLSYLSAQQLKAYGAGIFIVNLLGIAVIRELGPVLAAILVAGRSGSAMTAQIGVMRVTDEIDAMAVMGIPYTVRLVLPRIIALAISLPLIVLWTNAIALFGGMVAAHYKLDISIGYFISALPEAVPVANLWLGLSKSIVFGILIALLACHFGLRIEPNTESLGIGTTNSVVAAITIVILVDAIFAVLFSDVGVP
ncbi:MAG: MlaE family lipid ABC transporter permease subunit [Betaproteobacteria bacterium]|nr:MlaE family lipid ABC transporter permease subunit [Betaproteobacteria bacterium]